MKDHWKDAHWVDRKETQTDALLAHLLVAWMGSSQAYWKEMTMGLSMDHLTVWTKAALRDGKLVGQKEKTTAVLSVDLKDMLWVGLMAEQMDDSPVEEKVERMVGQLEVM